MKPEMRQQLAQQSFEEKIRKVSELIQLSRKMKTSSEGALLERLDRAAAELDAGKSVPIARVREHIRDWAKKPKNTR
jgi:prephenate dehydrogenase